MMRGFWTWRVVPTLVMGVVLAPGCTLDAEGTGDGLFDSGTADAGGSGGMLDGSAGSGGVIDASAGAAGAVGGMAGAPPDGGAGIGGSAGDAGGAAGQGGTGGTTFEKCDDGVDNDGDGNADCLDDECTVQRYQCTPPVPDEWIGYFRVHVLGNANPAPTPDACPAGAMPERYYSGKAGPAACEACTCGALQGAQCSAPGVACDYEHSDCSNATPQPSLGDFECHNLSGKTVSCKLTGDNPVSEWGSCESSPAAPDFPNKLPFTDIYDTCIFDSASTAAGCGSDLCMAPGSGAYGGALCVMQADDQAVCPPRWDAKPPIRLYKEEDVFDGRACEPCACEPDQTSIQCVGGSYEVWDLNNCNDCDIACDDETVVNSANCKDLSKWADIDYPFSSNASSIKVKSRPTIENGACKVGGGKATGFVETAKGVTFCCLSI